MLGLFSNIIQKVTQGNNSPEQKVLEAKHETDILNHLRNNVKDFTIDMIEVDCLKYSRKYIKQLFDAIDRSDMVRKLNFILESGDYNEKDWKTVVKRVANNTNITTISIIMDFSREISTELVNLFEKSTSINRLEIQFPLNFNNTANDIMQRSNFETLSKGVHKSTSIDSIKISEGPSSDLQKTLDAIQPLIQVISKMKIYNMELFDVSHQFMGAILSQMHDSSISDLTISKPIHYSTRDGFPNLQPLGELLTKNGNIKRLSFLSTGIKDQSFGQILDSINNSKHLKQLKMMNETVSDRYIGDIIEHNTSLEALILACFSSPFQDLEFFADALKKNKNLTRIDIQGKNITSQGYINLGEAMKGNSTLKKFYLSHNERMNNADVAPLFEGLKFNTSLNALAITSYISGVGHHTNEIMKTNRALIDIIPKEFKIPHPQLFSNKKNQDAVVLGGNSLIYTLCWHTDSFLAILPLEIWYNIFSQMKCPGVAINFSPVLKELLSKKTNVKTM